MIFMEPTEEFVKNVMALAGTKTVVDVGAGRGAFGKLAREMGYHNVMSIDLFPKTNTVIEMDAFVFPFNSKQLPMFIRPCHGGWVQDLMEKNIGVVDRWLYVSMPSNFVHDLPMGRCGMEQHYPEWQGPEGERLVTITLGEVPKMVETFYLVEDKRLPQMGMQWMQQDDEDQDWYMNLMGGRRPKRGVNLIKTVECDEDDLDHSVTYLSTPDAPGGWLAPDGTFHGCNSRLHTEYAVRVLKKDPSELEGAGWVHVYGSYDIFGDGSFAYTEKLTQAQRTWLVGNGHRVGVLDVQKIKSELDEDYDGKA